MKGKTAVIAGATSSHGQIATQALAGQVATKHRDIPFSHALAQRINGNGVMVNLVIPGFVATRSGNQTGRRSEP